MLFARELACFDTVIDGRPCGLALLSPTVIILLRCFRPTSGGADRWILMPAALARRILLIPARFWPDACGKKELVYRGRGLARRPGLKEEPHRRGRDLFLTALFEVDEEYNHLNPNIRINHQPIGSRRYPPDRGGYRGLCATDYADEG